MMEDQIVLRIRHISKAFPGVKALDDISFNIERGTVHALVGENGAGKSTLIKVLAGIYVPDEGELLVNGQCVKFRVPRDARNAGISVVHQEIKLAAPLTVTENVFIGQLVYNRMGLVNWRAMRKRAKQLLDELGANIDVNAPVESLTIAKQQIVEIVKAINTECRVLIMDEPSAVLTDNELKILFQIILKLKEKGYTIIYISHRLDEIFSLADRVTVLRDGRHIETMSIGDLTRDKLIIPTVNSDRNVSQNVHICALTQAARQGLSARIRFASANNMFNFAVCFRRPRYRVFRKRSCCFTTAKTCSTLARTEDFSRSLRLICALDRLVLCLL